MLTHHIVFFTFPILLIPGHPNHFHPQHLHSLLDISYILYINLCKSTVTRAMINNPSVAHPLYSSLNTASFLHPVRSTSGAQQCSDTLQRPCHRHRGLYHPHSLILYSQRKREREIRGEKHSLHRCSKSFFLRILFCGCSSASPFFSLTTSNNSLSDDSWRLHATTSLVLSATSPKSQSIYVVPHCSLKDQMLHRFCLLLYCA